MNISEKLKEMDYCEKVEINISDGHTTEFLSYARQLCKLYDCAFDGGYDVMQPILSGDLLEISSASVAYECTHIINSSEYLENVTHRINVHIEFNSSEYLENM